MAKMGLSVRDDPPRVIDVATRQWGDTVDGLQLSIEQNGETLSVVLRNAGAMFGTVHYAIEIEAPLTPYGREVFKRQPRFISPATVPGEIIETQIPLTSLYELKPGERSRIQIIATLPDGQTLRSNTCPGS